FPVDERHGYPVTVDGVPRAKVAMGDDLPGPGRTWAEAVAGDRGLEPGSRRVQLAQQVRHGAQGKVGPGIWREPVPMPGLPLRVHRDVPVDKRERLPGALDAQHLG